MVLSMKKPMNKGIKSEQIEELHYGPGIVSKLRCRYMSLTLNQGCTKQRPSLNFLRRSTSLNNLFEVSDSNVIVADQVKNNLENGEANAITQSYETLLEPKKKNNLTCNRKNIEKSSNNNQNEQPPPDMVKEKLRIFEPNWMNSKKVHYPKKYVTNKQVNAVSSKNVTNLREKYQENDECTPSFASKAEKPIFSTPVKSNFSFNKQVVEKSDGNESNMEKQNLESITDSKPTIANNPKRCHKISHLLCSVENQSMIYNFSKRKEIPSHLPDVSMLDDKRLTVVSKIIINYRSIKLSRLHE